MFDFMAKRMGFQPGAKAMRDFDDIWEPIVADWDAPKVSEKVVAQPSK